MVDIYQHPKKKIRVEEYGIKDLARIVLGVILDFNRTEEEDYLFGMEKENADSKDDFKKALRYLVDNYDEVEKLVDLPLKERMFRHSFLSKRSEESLQHENKNEFAPLFYFGYPPYSCSIHSLKTLSSLLSIS
jgi:hypothetical protein